MSPRFRIEDLSPFDEGTESLEVAENLSEKIEETIVAQALTDSAPLRAPLLKLAAAKLQDAANRPDSPDSLLTPQKKNRFGAIQFYFRSPRAKRALKIGALVLAFVAVGALTTRYFAVPTKAKVRRAQVPIATPPVSAARGASRAEGPRVTAPKLAKKAVAKKKIGKRSVASKGAKKAKSSKIALKPGKRRAKR